MKITETVCDICGTKMDYIDADGDTETEGFKAKGAMKFTRHIKTDYGSSHPKIDSLEAEDICSPECVAAWVGKWLENIVSK